jgi:hypothetical protein
VDFPVVRPLLPVLPWQPTPAAAPPARIGNPPPPRGGRCRPLSAPRFDPMSRLARAA